MNELEFRPAKIVRASRFYSLRLILLSAVLLMGRASNLSACSCHVPSPVETRFENVDVVFIGELVGEQRDYEPVYPLDPPPGYEPPDRTLRFQVLTSWKGVTGTEVGLITEAGGSFASCGFFGEIGEQYLIYASLDKESNRLRVHLCSGQRVSLATEEIATLDNVANRIELTNGPDSEFPPVLYLPNLCGSGILLAMGASLLMWLTARCRLISGVCSECGEGV